MARPALIVAGRRTGGTFLSGCMSNHPWIFCTRGEPTHGRSPWNVLPNHGQRLNLLWNMQFYEVSMTKLIGAHAKSLWKHIIAHKPPVMIIHLERKDLLAQAVSINLMRHRTEGHPVHSVRTEVNPPKVSLSVAGAVNQYKLCHRNTKASRRRIEQSGLPALFLTYEEITASTGGTNPQGVTCIQKPTVKRICRFLKVPQAPLCSYMRKVHPVPYSKLILNWKKIVAAMP